MESARTVLVDHVLDVPFHVELHLLVLLRDVDAGEFVEVAGWCRNLST